MKKDYDSLILSFIQNKKIQGKKIKIIDIKSVFSFEEITELMLSKPEIYSKLSDKGYVYYEGNFIPEKLLFLNHEDLNRAVDAIKSKPVLRVITYIETDLVTNETSKIKLYQAEPGITVKVRKIGKVYTSISQITVMRRNKATGHVFAHENNRGTRARAATKRKSLVKGILKKDVKGKG